MKECQSCGQLYDDSKRFCTLDGTRLAEAAKAPEGESGKAGRRFPPPPEPLPMRLTIVDADDEGHRSRSIQGLVYDLSLQGMRAQTGTIETGQLNIIRDHTVAFKNKLEVEVELPSALIKFTGFAAWYKPAEDGFNWAIGIYIRDMRAADRQVYDDYLKELSGQASPGDEPAESDEQNSVRALFKE